MNKKELEALRRKRTATLRKMAEKEEIPGWDKLERPELLEALSGGSKKEGKEPKGKKEVLEVVAPGVEEEQVPVGSKAERMKARLAKQSKVRVLIPLEVGEPKGATMSVILNNYRLNIAKGVYVDVPEQVADIIMESQKQTIKALEHPLKIKGKKPELEA